jgi:RNA polymerase sigma factor (sigma-70 family)
MAHRVADLELLERWRAGSRTAGNQLVARHFIGVRGYFIAKFTEDHEDLTQETFSRLVAGRDRFRGGSTFKSYLYSIARNVSHEHLRRRYKLALATSLETASLADLTGRRQSSILAGREAQRLLLDALRRLTLEQQELVELHYWQRLTGVELGQVYELPESTVRGRLRAALRRLGELYRELGAKPHSREIDEGEIERWLEELRELLGKAGLRPD